MALDLMVPVDIVGAPDRLPAPMVALALFLLAVFLLAEDRPHLFALNIAEEVGVPLEDRELPPEEAPFEEEVLLVEARLAEELAFVQVVPHMEFLRDLMVPAPQVVDDIEC